MNLPTTTDLLRTLQVALAGLLAGVVGWQRRRAGRPAGIRTHALGALAAVCFTRAGASGVGAPPPDDVTRVAAQVVTGIGFRGAGTIFRARDQIYGLPTAATLWVAAALGVLIGAGLSGGAVFSTVMVLLLLLIVSALLPQR